MGFLSFLPQSRNQGYDPLFGKSGETSFGDLPFAERYGDSLSTSATCYDGDVGPNTTGSFANDIQSELGGNTSINITGVVADPAASSIVVS
jgi:hypothetical protein